MHQNYNEPENCCLALEHRFPEGIQPLCACRSKEATKGEIASLSIEDYMVIIAWILKGMFNHGGSLWWLPPHVTEICSGVIFYLLLCKEPVMWLLGGRFGSQAKTELLFILTDVWNQMWIWKNAIIMHSY